MSIISALKKKAMRSSREKKLDHFFSLCTEGMSVLDVGVSPEEKQALPARNYFLKKFRYPSKYYTGLGVRDLSGMELMFPGKRFVRYPGGRFPFGDREFDWAFSNAVIEHVGDEETQLHFINEMLRVAGRVFFTTPNKYFPLESHTNVLLLHWSNSVFYAWCRKRRPGITKENLYLFSYARLRKLLDNSDASTYTIVTNRFLGLPMTFSVVTSKY